MINTTRRPAPRMHLPLRRLALCLDCDECFEISHACPACGSETWTSLARFLEWKPPESVTRLLGTPEIRARHLIVVSRERVKLYEQLKHALAGTASIQVILDRRRAERRRASVTPVRERRRIDRRVARGGAESLHTAHWSVLVIDLLGENTRRETRGARSVPPATSTKLPIPYSLK